MKATLILIKENVLVLEDQKKCLERKTQSEAISKKMSNGHADQCIVGKMYIKAIKMRVYNIILKSIITYSYEIWPT